MSEQLSCAKSDVTFQEVITSLEALSVDTEKMLANHKEIRSTYYVGYEREPFDEWLEDNMPSTIRNDEVHFVGVFRKPNEEVEHPPKNVIGLTTAFTQAVASGKSITKQLLFELAEKFHTTSGKWMLIPVTTGLKVDVLWAKVAWAIADARLPCKYAKVSTTSGEKFDDTHVICIYNSNFLNLDEVRALESGIRSIGIRCRLIYKPDVFTYCGIYTKNQWRISPVIYKSNYDIKLEQSRIDLF